MFQTNVWFLILDRSSLSKTPSSFHKGLFMLPKDTRSSVRAFQMKKDYLKLSHV